MGQTSRKILAILRAQGVTYTLYPVVGAGAIPGATVTSGAGAWGADKEIIAAAAILGDFWIVAMDLDTAGAVQPYVVELEIAGATSIFAARCDLSAVTSNVGRFRVPYPRFIPGGSQVTARASATGANTINVSALVAQGL